MKSVFQVTAYCQVLGEFPRLLILPMKCNSSESSNGLKGVTKVVKSCVAWWMTSAESKLLHQLARHLAPRVEPVSHAPFRRVLLLRHISVRWLWVHTCADHSPSLTLLPYPCTMPWHFNLWDDANWLSGVMVVAHAVRLMLSVWRWMLYSS